MSMPFFFYRRLARWITCEFSLSNTSRISLQNKYEVASFQDVFCCPFYWQVFQFVNSPPKLVVDCGAHLGHFSILADICFQSKFNFANTQYILVEPNPFLLPTTKKNISEAGMSHRVELKQGLLGDKLGDGKLWINHKNYLATGLDYTEGAKPVTVPYIDLLKLVGKQAIDVLKIDIEGGEFSFVKSNLELFNQVNLIFMELHKATKEVHQELFTSLQSVGLYLANQPLEVHGQQLLIFQRQPVTNNK
ncbi:FkbM family methyltransferase [Iningainema tapete]|uniref:FkbM family methyltransferase n=1 Tax=Iningainema tapete BLCC-T55 TaxID=2748662 RepID=A0A8J7BX75_9CYAN|nr:FkbM family methyltransferase [Iningainema tapete]MBD2772398.1 FkbM family methyltransferase [Iningainema tapete BLCC-T55]